MKNQFKDLLDLACLTSIIKVMVVSWLSAPLIC